jgi:hypothetical protein
MPPAFGNLADTEELLERQLSRMKVGKVKVEANSRWAKVTGQACTIEFEMFVRHTKRHREIAEYKSLRVLCDGTCCGPSYSGGRGRRIKIQGQPWQS